MNARCYILAATLLGAPLVHSASQANDGAKPSAAAKHAAKAREQADKSGREGSADFAADAQAVRIDGNDKTPAGESPNVGKAAKDVKDQWKKMDKALEAW